MSEPSLDLELESEIGEQYYQCFDRWNFNRSSDRLHATCLELADSYQQVLVDHIAYLNSLGVSVERDTALRRYQEYLDLLLLDITVVVQQPTEALVR